MKNLKAGVIGLKTGYNHMQGYEKNPYVKLWGVCDLNVKLVEQAATEFGAKIATTDYQELLRSKDIDLVSVATPDYCHVEQSIQAMEAGKHVLCEKPMAPTLKECVEIIDTVKRTGKKFMIGQVARYSQGFKLAKKLAEEGRIGELFFVESEYAHDYSIIPGVGEWRKDSVRLREPFLGGGCHPVDLLRWIAGEAEEVFAYSNRKCLTDWPVDDCTIASFRFKNGIIGKVLVAIGCKRPYTMRTVLWGTKGTIICDNTTPELKLFTTDIEEATNFIKIPVDVASHNVGAEIEELVDCIINDKPVVTDAQEGMKTVVVCLAAVESSRKHQPVEITEG